MSSSNAMQCNARNTALPPDPVHQPEPFPTQIPGMQKFKGKFKDLGNQSTDAPAARANDVGEYRKSTAENSKTTSSLNKVK
jgi:hypothetical protein